MKTGKLMKENCGKNFGHC